MRMQVQAHVKAFFDFTDQLIRRPRREDARHVFNRNGVDAGLQQLFSQVEPGLQGVHRAGGVGEGALGVRPVTAHRL